MGLVCTVLNLFLLVLFVRVILSWFPISPGSGMASIYSVLYTITEPVLGPLRRALPPVGMGGMGLDLSPIIVFFAIIFITGAIC